MIESVQRVEGAFNLPSLVCQFPVTVSLDSSKHVRDAKSLSLHLAELDKDSFPHISAHCDDQSNRLSNGRALQEPLLGHAGSPVWPDKESSKTSSSGQGSIDALISQESSEEANIILSSDLRNDFDVNGWLGLHNPNTDANVEEPQQILGGILIEDSGSSKDLKILFNCVVEECHDENRVMYTNHDLYPTAVQGFWTATIKATYREDIMRFHLPSSAGMMD